MKSSLEQSACRPQPVGIGSFNPGAEIPYGLTVEHLCGAMNEFIGFIGFLTSNSMIAVSRG